MGGSSSRQTLYLGGLEKEILAAKTSSQLSEKILTAFFKTTDFNDLLSLTKIGDCNKYIWLTAGALKNIFDKTKVEPLPGQTQEVLYARSELVTGPQSTQSCLNVAYNYIRVFQVYAALALTVMDADPTRVRIDVGRMDVSRVKAPQATGWKLQRGGDPVALDVALQRSIGLLSRISNISGISMKKDTRGSKTVIITQPSRGEVPGEEGKVPKFEFKVEDITSKDAGRVAATPIWSSGRSKDVQFTIEVTSQTSDQFQLYVNGSLVDTFVEGQTGRFSGTDLETADDIFRRIGEIVRPQEQVKTAAQAQPKAQAAQGRAAGSTEELVVGYGNIRKLFFLDGTDGRAVSVKTVFPKAYCVARAMTLMNPIFPSEIRDKYRSQICRSTYDFEKEDKFMPRPGKKPGDIKYFKSLYSLYYDDFTVVDGKVVSTQTETGRSELRDASRDMAILFGFNPSENFFESGSVIQDKAPCQTRAQAGLQANQQVTLVIDNDQFRRTLQNETIKPMLDFQKKHATQVNALLSSVIKVTPTGGFTFTPAFVQGGRKAVDEFGKKARALLLQYYMASESYYSKGISQFVKNPTAWSGVIDAV